ncbi:replication initiation protein [Variovorax sp. 770b2]|uniref:replication initiation protein n=1 Tax=Variovorax sp. 770b2 TaxID=1566271 RepID=UPI0015A5C5E4|nr:replication initiation protein [Variovorax sp. 770b2]
MGDALELRKPHEMIVMVPRSARVTLTARRIYTVLLQVSQARLGSMEAMPLADFMFEAPLAAVLRTTGSDGADRTAAKRYLGEMRSLEVDWESTAPGDGVKWRGFSMLSEVALEVRRGETWVSWSFPPSIMTALRDPSRWARIELDVLARLSTYAAIALYEICVRYRDNPGGVTSRKPVGWWTDALSNMPGGDKREWRKFKNERVKEAVAEINQETDLEIELIEHRQGRVVSEVQFAVRRRAKTTNPAGHEKPVDANLVLRCETLGIREIKLDGLIKEFGEDRVRDQLDTLERRAAKNSLRAVDNAYSYLRSLLRNERDPQGEAAPEPAPPEIAPATPSLPVAASAEDLAGERIRAMRKEIEALDPAERQVWVDRALQSLASKKLLTAIVSRRASQGDVLHGMLGSMVVQTYAAATYGPDWNAQVRPSSPV